jgi:hypothetical protein
MPSLQACIRLSWWAIPAVGLMATLERVGFPVKQERVVGFIVRHGIKINVE